MLFPNSAKQAIAGFFYDKTVEVLDKSVSTDDEGGVVKQGEIVKSTFKSNVRFTRLGELQAEIGLVENIDVAITCPTDTPVEVDDILRYNAVKYVAVDVLPRDSHKLIVGRKWAIQ
jgi:hypothetical protein